MQEDFVALQEEFKDMKERFGEQLGALDRQLEAQQSVTSAAQKRVICTEDLIRFLQEQHRLMANHWKQQCQQRDEQIRSLNNELIQYTIDFKLMKQTEASLSHELQCLQDRHRELRAEHRRRCRRKEELAQCLRQAQHEEAQEAEAADAARAQASQCSRLCELEAEGAGLRGQLQILEEWRGRREAEAQQPEVHWPHSCIWRDELDIREDQLEKITSKLNYTNNALHTAQAALASQRRRHEEIKRRHRDAEAELREDERVRSRWRRECLELRRAEVDLRRMVEALHPSLSPSRPLAEIRSSGSSSNDDGQALHPSLGPPRPRASSGNIFNSDVHVPLNPEAPSLTQAWSGDNDCQA
jgi:hypothetical protein